MTAALEVDLTSSVPAYEQIRQGVVAHVAAGRLRPGDRLPTIRTLATDLGLAPGTVARAFRELEAAGVVVTRRRAGTVVAAGAPVSVDGARRAARQYVERVRAAGLGDEEALALVRSELLGAYAEPTVRG
ncbi:GntR family transcriptional regulator [Cellulomonas endophytica]|uniref:GntR family transcriptional regulator n=1 Tax=Cellulomonas endophytica TaxID=2494735 RepID=UPI001011B398|nr:GntR family transcriptional regulator [Cellulomonas endophytica]